MERFNNAWRSRQNIVEAGAYGRSPFGRPKTTPSARKTACRNCSPGGWGRRLYEDALGGFTRTVRQGGKIPGERKGHPGKQVGIFLRAHKRIGDKHLQAIFG